MASCNLSFLFIQILTKRVNTFDDESCSEEGIPLSEDNLYRKQKNFTRYSLQVWQYNTQKGHD